MPIKTTLIERQTRNNVYRASLLANKTPAEIKMAEILVSMKVRYKEQKGFIAGDYHCIVDFYLPRPYRLAIEIDGGYHNTEDQRRRDDRKEMYLATQKVRVLRLTNDEVFEEESNVISKVRRAMNNPKLPND
jgi:leucyl-tRNA synthetase